MPPARAPLLTLIGVPVAYSIFDDWSQGRVFARAGAFVGRRKGGPETAATGDAVARVRAGAGEA